MALEQQSMKRCASAPCLRLPRGLAASGEGSSGQSHTEVYVVSRPFQDWGGKLFSSLPPKVREGIIDVGVCHYMTVFKTADGKLHQFDFGPQGGDIALGAPSRAGGQPWWQSFGKKPPKAPVVGEVREDRLTALPERHVFVGSTHLTLAEVRAYNAALRRRDYELHRNDCRHYVNHLVQHSTGYENASRHLLRTVTHAKADRGLPLAGKLLTVGQSLTDVTNWEKIEAAGRAVLAAVATIASRGALTPVVARMPLLASVSAAADSKSSMALVTKPVTTGAVAVGAATYPSWAQTPGLREVLQLGHTVTDTTSRALQVGIAALVALSQSAQAASTTAFSTSVGLTNHAAVLAAAMARAGTRGSGARAGRVATPAAASMAASDQAARPLMSRLTSWGSKKNTRGMQIVAVGK